MAEIELQPDLKHQQREPNLAENDHRHGRNRFEDEVKLVRKQPAEQGWSEDKAADDFPDDTGLSEQSRSFPSKASGDKDGDQLNECERDEFFRLVNGGGGGEG